MTLQVNWGFPLLLSICFITFYTLLVLIFPMHETYYFMQKGRENTPASMPLFRSKCRGIFSNSVHFFCKKPSSRASSKIFLSFEENVEVAS